MKNILRFSVALVLVSGSFLISKTAYADVDRDATAEEKAKVTETLKQKNCTVGSDVDYIQNMGFEAEDVKCDDGKEYDVFLDDNFAITSKREDVD